jgi:hypothetical protein
MAATAMTIRSNVASIGDMAFLDLNIFLIDIAFHLLLFEKSLVHLFNMYEPEM